MRSHVDLHHLRQRKSHAPRRPLPWLASPVDEDKTLQHQTSNQSQHDNGSHHDGPQSDKNHIVGDDRQLGHEPTTSTQSSGQRRHSSHSVVFKPRHESTAIELFYDLFFVGNLTVYTNNNEIESADAMASYMGFFALIWFTWLQVSLFDVRFATDSVWSRLCKTASLFCMGLFGFASPLYDTSDVPQDYIGFRVICYALLIQRGVLVLQYGAVLVYVRKYRGAVIPIVSTIVVHFVAGLIFTGLIFTFHQFKNSYTYIVLYVVSAVEALSVIGISSFFRTISFRSSNLVERIGLLTLIILGEGVIGLLRAISTALYNVGTITHTMIGLSFGALVLLHELWILYFDQIEHDRFGTIRQQIWLILHFPLHMALILTMQGNSRFVIFKTWYDADRIAFQPYFIPPFYNSSSTQREVLFHNSQIYARELQHNITTFNGYFYLGDFGSFYNYAPNITYLSHLNFNTTNGQNAALAVFNQLTYAAAVYAFKQLGIEPPDTDVNEPVDLYNASIQIFVISYIYFVVGAGFVLIILGIMYGFGQRSKSRFEYASMGVRIGIGIALTLFAVTSEGQHLAADNLVEESWIIPIVLLIYAFVIAVDEVLIWLGWRRYQRTKDGGTWEDPSSGVEDQLGQPVDHQ